MSVPPKIDDAYQRIARRERINEIYRAAWDPRTSRAGLPYTPDDHIHTMRWWLSDRLPLRDCPAVRELIAAKPVAGYEYALLLVEEVLDINGDSRMSIENPQGEG